MPDRKVQSTDKRRENFQIRYKVKNDDGSIKERNEFQKESKNEMQNERNRKRRGKERRQNQCVIDDLYDVAILKERKINRSKERLEQKSA